MIIDKYYFFWSGFLSQWHMSDFQDQDERWFCNSEQYMMYHKAKLFKDEEIAERIMNTNNPSSMKHLGNMVKGFNSKVWDKYKQDIVFAGNMFKFMQNPILKRQLLYTEDLILVEASPHDDIWGIGMAVDHPDIVDETKWRGQNLLGKILMRVRDEMKKQNNKK